MQALDYTYAQITLGRRNQARHRSQAAGRVYVKSVASTRPENQLPALR